MKKKPTDDEVTDLAAAGAVVVYRFEDGTTHRVPLVKQIVTESRQKGELIEAKRQEAERADAEHRAKSGSHAPRQQKAWALELVKVLRKQHPDMGKKEVVGEIPDDPDEPLVVTIGIREWKIYRVDEKIFAIDGDADPLNTEPEALARSTFIKSYL